MRVEALASGLPAVVTDQCGSADWVRPGHTGWVIPAADAGALASVLEEALTRRAMGAAARRDIEAREPAAALQQLGAAVRGALRVIA